MLNSAPVLNFEVLFAALPAPHAVLNTEGAVLYINDALQNLLASSGSEVAGQPLLNFLAAAEVAGLGLAPAADWPAALAEASHGKASVTLPPVAGCEALGGRCWQATLQPVPAEPTPIYLLLRLLDVTEQVHELAAGRESRDQLSFIIETLPLPLWMADGTGAVTYANQHWSTYTGLPLAETQGDGWAAAAHPDDLPAMRERWQHCQSTGENPELTARLYHASSGTYRWNLIRAFAQHDAGGAIQRWVGVTTDVDDAQRVRQELETSDQLLGQILFQSPALIALLEGPEHRFRFTNPGYDRLVGGRARLGQPAAQCLPELVGQGFIAMLDNVYRTGEEFVGLDLPVTLHDAEQDTDVPGYFDFTCQALHDGSGHIFGVLAFIVNVTDRALARQQTEALTEELRRSEEELRIQAESIPQLVWTARPDGSVDFYNHRTTAYLGKAPTTESLANWLDFVHPDDREATAERWATAIANRRYYEAEYRLRRYDGRYRWFLAQAQARHDSSGKLLCWYGTNTDIEDQKQTQRQLVAQNTRLLRSNQDLDNFVYTASHDLKQPIHNMAGIFEELTRTAYFRDPDAIKLIAMFEQALGNINSTIDNLAAIVRTQREARTDAPETVALAPLVEEVINSLQEDVNRLGARFDIDFSRCEEVPFVRSSLQSLFYNLISNALKYAAPGRHPHIRLNCAPDAAKRPVLTVTDNGLGIDLARYGSQLFKQFARFHPHIDGSGMGLYLVNRLVQQQGGRIEVESVVGQGTTFRVYLG